MAVAIRRAVEHRGPIQIVEIPSHLREADLIAFKERRGNEKLKKHWAAGAA